MSTMLGDSIFKDIESNEYLQEIFNCQWRTKEFCGSCANKGAD